MQNVTLNNGVEMPILGFGVYQVPADDTEQVVAEALGTGYRLIDTAASYQNEEAVGRALNSSGFPREELFVTTKLWMEHAGYDATKAAFHRSLDRLGLDYLDLYLIHQPFNDYYGAWRAMQELNQQGLVRAIGVCNFHPDRLVDLIEHNDVTPAVNQIETHVYYQRGDDHRIMRDYGVAHQSWGPFAEGSNDMFTDPTLTSIGRHTASRSARSCCAGSSSATSSPSPNLFGPHGCGRTSTSSTSNSPTSEMNRIAAMDTGASLFFDHRDPAIVSQFSKRHIDV